MYTAVVVNELSARTQRAQKKVGTRAIIYRNNGVIKFPAPARKTLGLSRVNYDCR